VLRKNFFLVFKKKNLLFLLYTANIKKTVDSRAVVYVRIGELAILEFAEL
jgi:hypothetical protein